MRICGASMRKNRQRQVRKPDAPRHVLENLLQHTNSQRRNELLGLYADDFGVCYRDCRSHAGSFFDKCHFSEKFTQFLPAMCGGLFEVHLQCIGGVL
jgi:hypothetical protein